MNKKQQIIEVIAYDENWPDLYSAEVELIKPIFSDNYTHRTLKCEIRQS